MAIHTHLLSGCTLLAFVIAAGCVEDPLIPDFNAPPTAVAKIIDDKGESTDDPMALTFAYMGKPVKVKLDGSSSSDIDGKIKTYRWLSGTQLPDAGMAKGGRRVPEGKSSDWPEDEEKPEVELTEGVWTFDLWVIDDDGAVSEPDSIRITVGSSMAAANECVGTVLPRIPMGCKQCVCSVSDACRTAANQSMCGEDCWALVTCIRDKCPNFAMTMDTACVVTNCSMPLANGRTGATAIGGCVTMCADACASAM